MTINQATLAGRLKKAREAAAITQEDVAKVLGVARTAVVQIEAGNRAVSSLELEKLARLYHRDISEFFSAGVKRSDEDPLVVLHRLAPGLEEPTIKKQVDLCLQLCREGKALERILGRSERSGPPEYRLPQAQSAGDAIMQGLSVAAQERQRLNLGDAPIADIAELLNLQGVWATSIALPPEMSGLFVNHETTGMVIIVNTDHPETRMRFSYAHEYGHALMDRDRTSTISSKANANDLSEKRANAFAACLLMPEQGISKALQQLQKGQPSRYEQVVFDAATAERIDAQIRTSPGSQQLSYQDVTIIARWFNVSYEATVYRLRGLNHISQSECDGLIAQVDLANHFRRTLDTLDMLNEDETAVDASKEQPSVRNTSVRELKVQIAHLAIEAFRRELISRGRLLELALLIGYEGQLLLEFAEAARG
jgi:Zn-dependent peptidase ImmA (M78 family)/transcriptional regulator with XRE-family HTH domain